MLNTIEHKMHKHPIRYSCLGRDANTKRLYSNISKKV